MAEPTAPILPAILIDAETRAELVSMFAKLPVEVELHSFVQRAPVPGNGSAKAGISGSTAYSQKFPEYSDSDAKYDEATFEDEISNFDYEKSKAQSNEHNFDSKNVNEKSDRNLNSEKSNGGGEHPTKSGRKQEEFGEKPEKKGKNAVVSEDPQAELYGQFSARLCAEIAATSPRLYHVAHVGENSAFGEKITMFPTVLVVAKGGAKPIFRMTGAPLGEEARALVQAINLIGGGVSTLPKAAVKILAELQVPRHVRVFSSPGCPYCPGQAINALKAALERPELITAECITADEFPEYSMKYQVGSVPHTQFSEEYAGVGLMAETAFAYELTHLAPLPLGPILPDSEAQEQDLVILGGGPTGLSAAIYAARSGLKSVVLERESFGGQINVTPTVENYPGFASVSGMQLGEILTAHARQYAPLVRTTVQAIVRDYIFSVYTPERIYKAKALLFATGAEWKNLNVPGESKLFGKGVVHCASCDGYMYKGKEVVVVGGGNTALTDALHLKNLGVSVRIMHRRDAFRGEDALQKAVAREAIPVIWNSIAVEVLGDKSVTGLRIKDTITGKESVLDVAGVFIAVGQKPNSELAVSLGVAVSAGGAIVVDEDLRTTVAGVYAAGDVCGGTQQIVTAVSAGARAALVVFEDLQKQ